MRKLFLLSIFANRLLRDAGAEDESGGGGGLDAATAVEAKDATVVVAPDAEALTKSSLLQKLLASATVQNILAQLQSAGKAIDLNAILQTAEQEALNAFGVNATEQVIIGFAITALINEAQKLEASNQAKGWFGKLIHHIIDLLAGHSATPAVSA